jgi:hypothetical protein
MLDTGASISLLSERAFEALSQFSEVAYIKDINLNTAGAQVTTLIYQVNEFSKSFDFHIDQNNSLLILKNK